MHSTTILDLPSDVLILIASYLGIGELTAMSGACKFLHAFVCDFGWSTYLHSNSRPSFSLSKSIATWSTRAHVKYNFLTDRAWSAATFVARPMASPWKGKLRPLLAISPSRLVVAAGHILYSYRFAAFATEGEAAKVEFEASCSLRERRETLRDITSIAFLPDGGLDRTLSIAFDDGVLERVFLLQSSNDTLEITRWADETTQFCDDDFIECLACEGNSLLSLSSTGRATLINISSTPSSLVLPPQSIALNDRSWFAHLSMKSSSPYAAFGLSSITPLVVHPITNYELSPNPSAVLSPHEGSGESRMTAVYGIAGVPPASPLGSPDQILVSGWYDGLVRIHDLRSSTRVSTTNTTDGPAPLLPVLETLCDPWSCEPIYSISCGGGSSAFIAAGFARHSLVAFWDVRYPKLGWSVHAPGNDPSPVYSIILESSRLFGATQGRPFVYDFGLGVTHDTYPHVPGINSLGYLADANTVNHYVTRYSHHDGRQ